MTRILLFSFFLLSSLQLVAQEKIIERPNIEAAQRALQERYITYVQAARAANLPGANRLASKLSFPLRYWDYQVPGDYPVDHFYDLDLCNKQTGELNMIFVRYLISDLAAKISRIDDFGEFWVHPSQQGGLTGHSAVDGEIRTIDDLDDFYTNGLTVTDTNYEEVFDRIISMLKQMNVCSFDARYTGFDVLSVLHSPHDLDCAAVKAATKALYDSSSPTSWPYEEDYYYSFSHRQSAHYNVSPDGEEEFWRASLETVSGKWTLDFSNYTGNSGTFEIYGRLENNWLHRNDEGLLSASGAPHSSFDEWFSVESGTLQSSGVVETQTFADTYSASFVIGCPSAPGEDNEARVAWDLWGVVFFKPSWKHRVPDAPIECNLCDLCSGDAGVCSELTFGSFRYELGLGLNEQGSVGKLRIYTPTISPLTASPYDLKLNLSSNDAVVLRDLEKGNALRQIVTDQLLVDISVASPYREYVVRYYNSADKGALIDGFYAPDSVQSFKTITVSNPDAALYELDTTIDLSTDAQALLTASHGIPVGTRFQGFVSSTGTDLPKLLNQGYLEYAVEYTFYARDADNLVIQYYDDINDQYVTDDIIQSANSLALRVHSVEPVGGLSVVDATSSRTRSLLYNSDTSDPTENHNITLTDNQNGKIRKYSSVRVSDPVDANRFSITQTEMDANDNVILKTQTDYRVYPWNDATSEHLHLQAERIQVIEDPDGEALVTDYDYYDSAALDGDNYQSLKSIEYPDGSWIAYEYDWLGYIAKTIRPYKDSALSFVDTGNHVTTWYQDFLSFEGNYPPVNVTTELIDGLEVSKKFEVYIEDTSSGYRHSVVFWTIEDGASMDSASNLRTDTYVYADGEFAEEVAHERHEDGTMTFYSYSLDAVTGAKTTTIKTGKANVAGDDIVDGTQVVTVTNSQGGQVSRVASDIASGITLSSAITPANQFDDLGRPLMVLYLDGTSELRDYQDCCGIDTVTDRTGLVTTTTAEMDGTVESVEANGITTSFSEGYDTDNADGVTGFTRTTTVDGRGTNDSVVSRVDTYTPSGRMLASLDPRDSVNRLTTYTESLNGSGQWERSTTLPNNAISKQVFHRDGELYEELFDGETRQRIIYDVQSDTHGGATFNARTEQLIRLGSAGETTEWVKTYRDMLGRVYKVETPDPNGAGTHSVLTFYNSLGQRVRSRDADGQQMLYTYNDLGELEDTVLDVNADGIIDYDGLDRIVRTESAVINDPSNGEVVRQTVSVWETDSVDQATVIQLTDASTDGLDVWSQTYGQATHINRVYSGSGTVVETITRPDTTTETVTTVNGFQTSAVVQNTTEGTLSSVSYMPDDFDRVYQETDNLLGVTWTYSYFDNNQLQQTLSPESDTGAGDTQTTIFAYDVMDQLLDVTLPDTTVQSRRYYADGTLKQSFGSQTNPVEYTYDRQRRIKTMKTWQDFDESGEVGVSGSATTTWNYNPLGLLEEKEDDDLNSVDYTYTAAGRLKTKTNARGTTATYSYDTNSSDATGITYDDSLTPAVSYSSYDRHGRVKTITDASGTRNLDYENGQLMDETYSTGALSGYAIDRRQDGLNRFDQLVVKNGLTDLHQVDYGYDGASRLHTVSHAGHTVTHAYTPSAELRQTQTFNNGTADQLTVNLRYDKLNRLKSRESIVTGGATRSYSYQYNSLNQRERMTLADNSYWQYGYDSLGQVDSAVHKNASDTVFLGRNFGFTFDEIGNRTQATTNGRVATYTPNNLNEYDERQVPRALDVRGDANSGAIVTVNGNSTTRLGDYFYHELDLSAGGNGSQQAAITVTGTLPDGGDNNAPRVADAQKSEYLAPNPEVFDHDDDGNLTLDGKWSYTWDAENRLIDMETLALAYNAGAPRLKLKFDYDSIGRRFSKEVYEWDGVAYQLKKDTVFLYDGWNLVYELTENEDGTSAQKEYVWGNDLSGSMQGAGGLGGLLMVTHANLSTYYPTYDGNGNVMGYYDAQTGDSVAVFEYGPFGELIRSTGSKADEFNFRFSTKYEDSETGLLYYGYRYYDAETGRWLSRDPIEENGGLNLYGFVFNQPISFVDRLGLDTYAIDGTYANVTLPPSEREFDSTNVSDFVNRLGESEPSRYFGGPGVTPYTSQRGGKTFNGATGFETYLIVKDVLDQICKDRAQAERDGRDFKINLIGWSRGATAAIWVAKELGEIDCDCDGTNESLDVNFLGLYDAVEMIPSGPLVPGHRLPQWLPGDQGPPNSVPSNVQNFIHAQKTGGQLIRSTIPLPTTKFGHPNEKGYPKLHPYYTSPSVEYYDMSYASDHGEVGVSPSATGAHRAILEAASDAGVPIIVSDPYNHVQP